MLAGNGKTVEGGTLCPQRFPGSHAGAKLLLNCLRNCSDSRNCAGQEALIGLPLGCWRHCPAAWSLQLEPSSGITRVPCFAYGGLQAVKNRSFRILQ